MKDVLIGTLCGVILLIIIGGIQSCVIGKQIESKPTIADYKVDFIYRAYFRTEEDFYNSVSAKIEWLWRHNFEVIKLNYEYGNNMTQNLILRFACIKYKENKNV